MVELKGALFYLEKPWLTSKGLYLNYICRRAMVELKGALLEMVGPCLS